MLIGLRMKKGILTAFLIFPLVIYGRAGQIQKTSSDYVSTPESGQSKRKFRIHTVKKGETLYSISRKYDLNLSVINKSNNLYSNSVIKAGMKLKIPLSELSLSESDPVAENKIRESKNAAVLPVKSQNSDFSWPVRKIVSVTKESDISKGIGIFIKSNPGSKVFSACDGKVVKIGYMRGYGNYVVVSHGGRYLSIYSMITPVELKPGSSVRKGDAIGVINRDSGGVHFQISKSGKPLDPEKILPQRS